MGRPPIGKKCVTAAERKRKQRQRQRPTPEHLFTKLSEIDPATLSMPAQKKLASALRQQRRKLQADYADRYYAMGDVVRQRVEAAGKEYL